jgi:formate hydrogenlyase subunit 3/multisubunit Na+/H+ antiporter MnhD subunit
VVSGQLDLLPWLIGLPFAVGAAAFLFGPRFARAVTAPALVAVLALSIWLGWQVLDGGVQRHALGGWVAPLGIELFADGLAALMLIMTAAVTLPVALYARSYFGERAQATYFWPLLWFLVGAMNALYLSADVFNLYVTLELLGLSAVGLVTVAGGAAALAAGMRYLLAALAGSLFYLLGVALLYGAYGTVAIPLLSQLVAPVPHAWLAAALMVFGLAIKTALFPLHFWLPPAHGGAATPVSALLSGLVIKGSFYLLIRLWLDVFGALATPAAGQLLGALGAAAILWGSALALREARLKMLVAYSTVAQIGYLFLLFPLVLDEGAAASALGGGVFQALSHALAKAAMFLAAGNMVLSVKRDAVAALDGCSARVPLSLFAFGIAGVSLMGLPPSGGFIAKWLLLKAALAAGQWWWIVVMIAGGLLTAGYVFRVLRGGFAPAARAKRFEPVPRTLELTALALALASLALGFGAVEALTLLGVGG